MPYDLKGRNVLVTGGSRGIGAAISTAYAKEGCNLAINYLGNASRAEEFAAKLSKEFPDVKVVTLQADVGVRTDCEKLIQNTIKELGGLDVIASNAGWTKFAPFDNLDVLTEADWDKCYAVNTKAHLHLLKYAKPTFNANPDGGVLLICASTAGFVSSTSSSMGYAVSKAGALHLMRCLASSQGPKIRVNAVCPGLVLTEWGAKFSEEAKEHYRLNSATEAYPDADDVAATFIAASKNKSMTGQKLVVDSGRFIQP